MSLDREEDRLLARALADALDQDLAEVPSKEKLQQSHRFSGKFERKIRAIISESIQDQPANMQRGGYGRLARRWGTAAAVFVCVLGLLAGLSGGLLRMGHSKNAAMEDSKEQSITENSADEAQSEESVSETEETVEDVEEAAAEEEEGTQDQEPCLAPDWQEQILAESARADELVSWSFSELTEDGILELYTEVQPMTAGMSGVRLSEIYEVYYKEGYQKGDDWLRVYQGLRRSQMITADMAWMDGYELALYGMTRPGTYRLVRQVNQYRQALDIVLTSTKQ